MTEELRQTLTAKEPAQRKPTKADQLLKLIVRSKGATVAEIEVQLSWQPHTIRAAISRRAGRMEELALHPTVKPVQMIADAIRDVSGRGDIVLDIFGGSGSTLIAAHKTGRVAHLCELDPLYCDTILHRFETFAQDGAEQLVCGWPRASEATFLEAAE